MSYAHRDDSYHNGAITKLRKELSGAIAVATGDNFSIFQDHEDIAWGEHWPSKLEQGVTGSRFLIAILSPSFFKSDHCRKELTEFLEIERQAGRNDLILPIYFRTTPHLENQQKRDAYPLAKAISQRQYRDWRELRHLSFDEYKVRRALDSLADELVQAIERSEAETLDGEPEIQPYTTSFDGQTGTYETGAFEDLAEFAHEAREQGLMEPQASLVASSLSTLPEPGTVFRDIDEPWCPEMVVIPPGTFVMGSPADEEGREENEEPEHRVYIEKPFALGIYPVTFAQFDHFCIETGRRKPDDQGWGRNRRPVINVSVEDAEAYLAWLTGLTGKGYDLPSEATWEYACRAGTITPFWTGATITTDQANFNGYHPYADSTQGRCLEQTTGVDSFPSNPFGLFDMHGNVWEWCADLWHPSYDGAPIDGSAWLDGGDADYCVLRGGFWFNPAKFLRSAMRIKFTYKQSGRDVGFRCARM